MIGFLDQILLWEEEKNRLRIDHVAFLEDFASEMEFSKCKNYAMSLGGVLLSQDPSLLVVTESCCQALQQDQSWRHVH